MKRGIIVFLLVVALGAGAAVLACLWKNQVSQTDWLRKEFSLDGEQAARVAALHESYQETCAKMCARIIAAEDRLDKLVRVSSTVTPELRAAIVETDRVRAECRESMLEHFYTVAAEMPPDQRSRYLSMVVPMALDPTPDIAQHRP